MVRALLPALALAALSACDESAPPPPAAPAADAGPTAKKTWSPTAESVLVVCDGRAPRGNDDHRLLAERMDRLAATKSAEAREVFHICVTHEASTGEARVTAARLLVDLGERDLVPELRKLLRDRSPELRLWQNTLISLVYKLRARELIPELSDAILITEEEAKSLGLSEIVESAVRVLVDFDTPESWAGIERAATDSRASVRRSVAQSLAMLFSRPKARARLLAFLDDPSPDVRSRACTLLLYDPETRKDRRPDLFRSTPCFVPTARWPETAARVRQAIATLDEYQRRHPPPKRPEPFSPPPGEAPPR